MSTASRRVRRDNLMWDDWTMEDNPPSTRTRMIRLINIPHRSRAMKRLEVTLNLEETRQRGTDTMRCVFEAKLAIDIDVNDDELRKAFIDMMCANTRNLYGPASMLAKNPPTLGLSLTTRSGKREIPLFEGALRDDSDDEDRDV